MFAVRNRLANSQIKTFSPQFADLQKCPSLIISLLFTICNPGSHNFQSTKIMTRQQKKTKAKKLRGGVDRASATDLVDSGSIPGRVKPNAIKIGIHRFPA